MLGRRKKGLFRRNSEVQFVGHDVEFPSHSPSFAIGRRADGQRFERDTRGNHAVKPDRRFSAMEYPVTAIGFRGCYPVGGARMVRFP